MRYKELTVRLTGWEEYQKDLLIADLGDAGFDTFEETTDGFKAYVQSDVFDTDALEQVMAQAALTTSSYAVTDVAEQNWNAVWESNFEPLLIDDQCYIRASFHTPRPDYPYELVIEPKMSFGTGHHQTTSLMISYLLQEELEGKSVLDMGSGTAILAILSEKRGANDVLAIDYDPVCLESAVENARINQATQVNALCGSKEAIPDRKFDLIVANINRNILLDQLAHYARHLQNDGKLFISGFYLDPDLAVLTRAAEEVGLIYKDHKQMDDWVAACFTAVPVDPNRV